MNNLTYQAEECNAILPAKHHNNVAFNASISKGSVLVSSSDEEAQLHEADKCNAKIHYLSRSIAKEYGVIPSAVLTGFAYKLKYHRKNKWKDRWWYYEAIEVLRTHRWPYLSDGCICETTEYLEEKKLLIKDCNNKLSYDRTTWYAMDDEVRNAALSDLVWFDVFIAKKFKNIYPGLIYHNLRYHLREILKQDPECQIPYHKLNKAMLARVLPMSESTAKRWVNELVKEKLFIRHPKKRNLYTLADESEYRQIGSSANAIRSSANAIGSSTNGSSANAIRSSANAIGSSANAIGSTANNNTQYETNEKPVRNQSQKDGCVSAESFPCTKANASDDKLNNASFIDQKDISDTVDSAPLRGKEGTEAVKDCEIAVTGFKMVNTFEQLIHQVTISNVMLASLNEGTKMSIHDSIIGSCAYFVEEHMKVETIYELWDTKNRDQLVRALKQPFADYVAKDINCCSDFLLTNEQLWQFLYFPCLETLVKAFGKDDIWSGEKTHTMPELCKEIWPTHCALCKKLKDNVDFAPEVKCRLLKEHVIRFNANGWYLSDKSLEKNAVQPIKSAFKKLRVIFENNPHLSVSQVIRVIRGCLEVIYFEEIPDGYDKYWAARQASNLEKLAQHFERIIAELDMFNECPVTATSDKETI